MPQSSGRQAAQQTHFSQTAGNTNVMMGQMLNDSNGFQGDNMKYNFSKRPNTTVKRVDSGRVHGNSENAMKMSNHEKEMAIAHRTAPNQAGFNNASMQNPTYHTTSASMHGTGKRVKGDQTRMISAQVQQTNPNNLGYSQGAANQQDFSLKQFANQPIQQVQ